LYRGYVGYEHNGRLLSPAVTYDEFSSRFHGNDERIDLESLRLTTQCWFDLCRDFLG